MVTLAGFGIFAVLCGAVYWWSLRRAPKPLPEPPPQRSKIANMIAALLLLLLAGAAVGMYVETGNAGLIGAVAVLALLVVLFRHPRTPVRELAPLVTAPAAARNHSAKAFQFVIATAVALIVGSAAPEMIVGAWFLGFCVAYLCTELVLRYRSRPGAHECTPTTLMVRYQSTEKFKTMVDGVIMVACNVAGIALAEAAHTYASAHGWNGVEQIGGCLAAYFVGTLVGFAVAVWAWTSVAGAISWFQSPDQH